MWKPVRPATGMKNRPATHITASLRAQGVKDLRILEHHIAQIGRGPWQAVMELSITAPSKCITDGSGVSVLQQLCGTWYIAKQLVVISV